MKAIAILISACLLTVSATCVSAAEFSGDFVSLQGLFHVRYRPEAGGVPVNRIHAWVIHVENAKGEPVEDASLTVDGGMPAHNHGLPTAPRQTRYLGGGDYLVEGLRFHMMGEWEIRLDISAGGKADKAVIPLHL